MLTSPVCAKPESDVETPVGGDFASFGTGALPTSVPCNHFILETLAKHIWHARQYGQVLQRGVGMTPSHLGVCRLCWVSSVGSPGGGAWWQSQCPGDPEGTVPVLIKHPIQAAVGNRVGSLQ